MKITIPTTINGSRCLIPGGPSALTPSGPSCHAPSGPSCLTPSGPSCLVPDRLEAIAKRQRDARKRDLLFAFVVALAAMSGATTVGAAFHGAAPAHTALV